MAAVEERRGASREGALVGTGTPGARSDDVTGSRIAACPARSSCRHCAGRIPAGLAGEFCCEGCRAVHDLLHASGFGRYYALRTGGSPPAAPADVDRRDLKWLESVEERVRTSQGATRVAFDLQGLHCAACVWLIEQLFRRERGGIDVHINPALGTVDLTVTASFPLRRYVQDVERYGYLFGPRLKTRPRGSSELVTRMGVCIGLAINSMIFALPLYLGLRSGPVHTFFRHANLALSLACVVIGGGFFVRSAWTALRRRIVHLDTPIAVGIVLATAGSLWSFAAGRDGATYFDTINVFISLMLVGRWLQERVLDRNRNYLLASDGIEGILTRKISDGSVALVPATTVREGDRLVIAPGDLLPVDAQLENDDASFSLDWITGESTAATFRRDDAVPAGAFNVGARAVTLRVTQDFGLSALVGLLRTPRSRGPDAGRATERWQRFARWYVPSVLAVAAGAFGAWWLFGHDARRALEVTTAVLVVTCPCAIGLATPLAYELVQARLRQSGLFVRTPDFLDRAPGIRRIVFDKTGTLTTAVPSVVHPETIDRLPARTQQILFNLASRSTHPKSLGIVAAIPAGARRWIDGIDVVETPGKGLAAGIDGSAWRLGTRDFACADSLESPDDVHFSCNREFVAAIDLQESTRPDARGEVLALETLGYETWILSGDREDRVQAVAERVGVPRERAVGDQRPEDKARWLEAHDRRDTLMIGDGINDAPAVERAFASGTPAVDRPFMPSRTDFYFVSAGLEPVRLALRAAERLAAVTRRNMRIALAYNAVAIGLAYAGIMSPLLCAVLMPASSIGILALTIASLSDRSARWRS